MQEKKALTSALCTISALSFSLGAMAAQPSSDSLFEAESLDRGFMSQHADFGEGKCGEGKCGEGKCGEKDDKDEEGSCGEGACGEEDKEDDKDEEGKCGEGTCGA